MPYAAVTLMLPMPLELHATLLRATLRGYAHAIATYAMPRAMLLPPG